MNKLYEGEKVTKAVGRLSSWCECHGVSWPDRAVDLFDRMIRLLLHYREQTNLTGFSTPEDIVDGFIDSLQILRLGELHGPMLDVGSGAGFPAIPIKIVCPELQVILVEPRRRRYAFLRKLEQEFELKNISIICGRIESFQVPAQLGCVTSKAFLPLPEWLGMCRPWALAGAEVCCWTTKRCWEESEQLSKELGYRVSGSVEESERIYLRLCHKGDSQCL